MGVGLNGVASGPKRPQPPSSTPPNCAYMFGTLNTAQPTTSTCFPWARYVCRRHVERAVSRALLGAGFPRKDPGSTAAVTTLRRDVVRARASRSAVQRNTVPDVHSCRATGGCCMAVEMGLCCGVIVNAVLAPPASCMLT